MTPFTYFVVQRTGQRLEYENDRFGMTRRKYVDTYARQYYRGALNLKKVQCAVWRQNDKDDRPYVDITLDQGVAAVFSVAVDEAERLFKTKFGPVEGPRKD